MNIFKRICNALFGPRRPLHFPSPPNFHARGHNVPPPEAFSANHIEQVPKNRLPPVGIPAESYHITPRQPVRPTTRNLRTPQAPVSITHIRPTPPPTPSPAPTPAQPTSPGSSLGWDDVSFNPPKSHLNILRHTPLAFRSEMGDEFHGGGATGSWGDNTDNGAQACAPTPVSHPQQGPQAGPGATFATPQATTPAQSTCARPSGETQQQPATPAQDTQRDIFVVSTFGSLGSTELNSFSS